MTTELVEETCEDCGGSGCDPGGLSEFEKTDCPVCFGCGKVFVEVAAMMEEQVALSVE